MTEGDSTQETTKPTLLERYRGLSRTTRTLLLSPAVIIVASAIRLLVISNYDPETATTIASATGLVGTLLGTLTPLVPLILPALVVILIFTRNHLLLTFAVIATILISPAYASPLEAAKIAWHSTLDFLSPIGWIFGGDSNRNHWPIYIIAVIGALIISIDPPKWLVAMRQEAIYAAQDRTLANARQEVREAKPEDQRQKPLTIGEEERALEISEKNAPDEANYRLGYGVMSFFVSYALYLILLIFLATLFRVPHTGGELSEAMHRPWVSTERVIVKGEIKPRVGYVISTKDGWVLMLDEKDRAVRYILAPRLIDRRVCSLDVSRSVPPPPLFRFADRRQSVPAC